MSTYFNLLLLHDNSDMHPRSWICVSGKKLPKLIKALEKEVFAKKGIGREELSRQLSSTLNCTYNTFKDILRGSRNFYPIPFVLLLSQYANNSAILLDINRNIDYLKVNSASSKPVKACKILSVNLAKFVGSFIADGSLSVQVVFTGKRKEDLQNIVNALSKNKQRFSQNYSSARKQFYVSINKNRMNEVLLDSLLKNSKESQCHYTIELTDAYQDNVIFFKDLIKMEFEIEPVSLKKRQNAWRVIYSSKILARYLLKFFSLWPGKKSNDAFEPELIKNSDIAIRKAFALGLLTFDGCITKQGKMCFSSNSKKLIESLAEIWGKDGISFGISENRGAYIINAYLENKKEKLLEYFEPNTQKWKLIHWLDGNLNSKPIIKETPITKISEEKILVLLRRVKNCDIIFLTNYFNCGQSTARYYLKTLVKQGRIIRSSKLKSMNPKNVSPKTTVLLNNKNHTKLFIEIKRSFIYDNMFAKTLGFKKATFSAWRTRRNRIPIGALEMICKALNLDLTDFCSNLIEEDREIIQIL